MKLVIQRVKKATVSVPETGKKVGSINEGLFVLVGIGQEDNLEVAQKMALKLSKLRIMADKELKMNLSIKDLNAEVLIVSQFTLHANTSTSNRPSFIKAAEPKKAKEIYDFFVSEMKNLDIKIQTGSFGDYMEISTLLDGPVTILIE